MDFTYLHQFGMNISQADFEKNRSIRVVVGMSGGVDSSVSALVLKLMGYEVIGLFMKNWEEEGPCPAEVDYQDVEKVCEKIGIPYYAVNFAVDYQEKVFQNFLSEYQKGNTPNPDILCNKEIKFKVFLEEAKKMGAQKLATGHYAQVKQNGNFFELHKGADAGKDQSYFLYTLTSDILSQVLFPIGHLQKKQVRQIAQDFNLSTAGKKDSTGICFIGEREFRSFLGNYLHEQKGKFVRLDDQKIMGDHSGQCYYTIGQRKGLGLGGPGGPWFVARKNPATNEVFVVEGENHPALYAMECEATDLTFVTTLPHETFKAKAKVRYRQADQDCEVVFKNNKLLVTFDRPQRAITVGQSLVIYQNDELMGGGIISSVGPSFFDQKFKIEFEIQESL